jgi:hypothetical protein
MPRLPAFNPIAKVNHSPTVVILGAGASKAAFPNGDANGKRVPVMNELVECLELGDLLRANGFTVDEDFESLYDKLERSGRFPFLKAEIESRVRTYFESLVLPPTPTLYDFLLLSLRENDLIATFNWDPFLALALMRNRSIRRLPEIAFLHGNVAAGVCMSDRVKGFRGEDCLQCGATFGSTKLLYPVRNKDYKSEPYIANEWAILETKLTEAYILTIFGYGAPATDAAAVDLMTGTWTKNPTFELCQVNIVDIKSEVELEETWRPFFCRSHYGIHERLSTTWIFRHPRRSGESLAMATLQNDPWPENPFPKFQTLSDLHSWIGPLIAEEEQGSFSGSPCPPL